MKYTAMDIQSDFLGVPLIFGSDGGYRGKKIADAKGLPYRYIKVKIIPVADVFAIAISLITLESPMCRTMK